MNERNVKIKKLVILSLLIAMEVILSRFLSISAWNIKLGFAFVPLAVAAMLHGPLAGGIVGASADLIGAILFPSGAFFPGFTATAFLRGVVLGLCLYKGQSAHRIAMAVGINQVIFSLIINTLWISILYGSPYVPLLGTRVLQSILMIVVQFVVISAMAKLMKPVFTKMQKL